MIFSMGENEASSNTNDGKSLLLEAKVAVKDLKVGHRGYGYFVSQG